MDKLTRYTDISLKEAKGNLDEMLDSVNGELNKIGERSAQLGISLKVWEETIGEVIAEKVKAHLRGRLEGRTVQELLMFKELLVEKERPVIIPAEEQEKGSVSGEGVEKKSKSKGRVSSSRGKGVE